MTHAASSAVVVVVSGVLVGMGPGARDLLLEFGALYLNFCMRKSYSGGSDWKLHSCCFVASIVRKENAVVYNVQRDARHLPIMNKLSGIPARLLLLLLFSYGD